MCNDVEGLFFPNLPHEDIHPFFTNPFLKGLTIFEVYVYSIDKVVVHELCHLLAAFHCIQACVYREFAGSKSTNK